MKRFLIGAVLLVTGMSGVASAATVVRGPYLQMMGPYSVTVVWRTDVATRGRVWIGQAKGKIGRTIDDNNETWQHEVRVDGLYPDNTYGYGVGTPEQFMIGDDDLHTFTTAPSVDTERPVTTWFLGDTGTGDNNQRSVRDAYRRYMNGRKPDLILHLGDIAYYEGTYDQFQNGYFNMYWDELAGVPAFPTLGNHEGNSSHSANQSGTYYDFFVLPRNAELGGVSSGTEAYYSFDYGPMHVAVLNSQDVDRSKDGAMARWLRADLANTRQPWIIATFHHPPYTKGTHDSDTEAALREMRENLLPILEAGGADLVLAGHSHIYERTPMLSGAFGTPANDKSKIMDGWSGNVFESGPYRKWPGANRGTVYVTAGHGGAKLGRKGFHPLHIRSETAWGSCVMTVDRTSLSVINIRNDGFISDRFTMLKDRAVHVVVPDGGDVVSAAYSYDIKWASNGSVGPVRLDYSADSGKSWNLIAEGVADTGRYTWQPPNSGGRHYRIRISSQQQNGPWDQSDRDFAIVSTPHNLEAVSMGSVWRYWDADGAPASDWNGPWFDDGRWASGPSPLGYGRSGDATRLDGSKGRSVYLRRTFQLDSIPTWAHLKLAANDGAAIFINGREVHRQRISGVEHEAFATAEGPKDGVEEADLDDNGRAAFVTGQNVIAVVVKPAAADDADLFFDLSLTVSLPGGMADGAGGALEDGGGDSAGGCGCDGTGASLVAGLGLAGLLRRRRANLR